MEAVLEARASYSALLLDSIPPSPGPVRSVPFRPSQPFFPLVLSFPSLPPSASLAAPFRLRRSTSIQDCLRGPLLGLSVLRTAHCPLRTRLVPILHCGAVTALRHPKLNWPRHSADDRVSKTTGRAADRERTQRSESLLPVRLSPVSTLYQPLWTGRSVGRSSDGGRFRFDACSSVGAAACFSSSDRV